MKDRPQWPWLALVVAGLLGASGVAIGAWAAHGAEASVGARAAGLIRTALPWQMWHALALAVIGAWALADASAPRRWLVTIAVAFTCGTLLFCGGVYVSALEPLSVVRHVAPIGGIALILAWIGLALMAGTRFARDRL